MPEPKVIEVAWPPLALGEKGWLQRLDDLAAEAEQLVGKPVTLQRTAELGLQLVGLIWPALSPETIAASCRASALLGVPVFAVDKTEALEAGKELFPGHRVTVALKEGEPGT